jgi:hypothetical protein
MLIGYARVSTTDQTLDLQKDALEKAGCERIFTDTVSGAKAERIGLNDAVTYVRKGDTLVVWRLDRLGRSLPHLIETITDLSKVRPHVRSQGGPSYSVRANEGCSDWPSLSSRTEDEPCIEMGKRLSLSIRRRRRMPSLLLRAVAMERFGILARWPTPARRR